MKNKIVVTYNIRVADKASNLFGVLREVEKTFNTLSEAMKFIRSNGDIVGKATLSER